MDEVVFSDVGLSRVHIRPGSAQSYCLLSEKMDDASGAVLVAENIEDCATVKQLGPIPNAGLKEKSYSNIFRE